MFITCIQIYYSFIKVMDNILLYDKMFIILLKEVIKIEYVNSSSVLRDMYIFFQKTYRQIFLNNKKPNIAVLGFLIKIEMPF